jgi:hypothetical protein
MRHDPNSVERDVTNDSFGFFLATIFHRSEVYMSA